jgi:outer membrane protein TolC
MERHRKMRGIVRWLGPLIERERAAAGHLLPGGEGLAIALVTILISFAASPAHAQELDQRFLNSVTAGRASSAPLSLTLRDAVDRALKNNLATLVGTEFERQAEAKRRQDLAELFPKVNAVVASEQRQVNLAAFGFSGFPGVRQVIGPFGLVDARATLSQPVLDFELRHNLRQSTEMQRAAAFGNSNTREMVVLSALDLYFRVFSSRSRVTAVEAELARATVLHNRAVDMKDAGIIPGIDVLRAQVEQRAVEQRLIQARNLEQKDKLALARVIGLPLDQEFALADSLPLEGEAVPPLAALLEISLARRADLKALDARVRAAEEDFKSVNARKLPSLAVTGDYGAIGRTPFNSHGTFSMRVEARVPLFDRNIDGEAAEKQAIVRQRQSERDSLRGSIEMDVRSALLDLQSAQEELRVSRDSLTLSQQQLDQAQDRFTAGVANNLEVVQAQQDLALSDERVIQSLYGFNIARALLARATGSAERSVSEFFPGSTPK